MWTSLCLRKGPSLNPVPTYGQGEGLALPKGDGGERLAKNNSPILHLNVPAAQCFLKLKTSEIPGVDRSDALWKCYRKVILTLVEMVRKSLFKTIAIGGRDQAHL